MKRFFNVIAGTDKAACILLYGDIGEWGEVTSADIVGELLEMENEYERIDARINSMGGDVYSGIAIVNAFRNSKANITIYVDGVAASMASIIALCGKPLYMSKYARLMLHSVRGGAYGTKDDLKDMIREMETLEDTLCDFIAGKVNKTKEEVKELYFDGKDHWLSAQEALGLGLIDGIYDVDPVPEDSTNEQVYKIFNNRLEKPKNKKDEMNLEEIRKRPAFANCATEADVLRQIDQLESEAGKVPGLEEKILAFENKAKETEEAEDDAFLDTAIAEERIKEAQRVYFKNQLKTDREGTKNHINSLKPKKKVIDNLGTPLADTVSAWDKKMEEIRNKTGQ
ncbi:ATP-dependent Clp endopeptidase proteolytic subunit ClpP [Dysgonomonadaceae bacterium PH5-43]|nr:ATP-dependent Clp endopeptidase proteolytic subunit ClpP [Dysgonomonadaceae bacterium PH5-43]